jgi:N6-L-threonylcarbamoyladenine synthase
LLVLGIDTSCDETAAAIVKDGLEVASNVVSSQIPLHRRFGGVVPEIACRAHTENISRVIERALTDAGCAAPDLDGVAVTNRPGLIGALLVGVSAGKAIALAHDLPLVGVNHIEAHIFASALEGREPELPAVALVVSGGHTTLFLVKGVGDLTELGRTVDDAAGEAFDKAAAMLGLGYPGGPAIEEAGRDGDPKGVPFKRPYLAPDSLDFSFSGLKTALLYHSRGQDTRGRRTELLPGVSVPDAAASFQETIVDVLVRMTFLAVKQTGVRRVIVGGGVAANTRLRERMEARAEELGVKLTIPKPVLCTDNAAMVAAVGCRLISAGQRVRLSLDAHSRVVG